MYSVFRRLFVLQNVQIQERAFLSSAGCYETGKQQMILCGRAGAGIRSRAQFFPADICLMLALRRMAFPFRFVDLVNIFGLPTIGPPTEFVISIIPQTTFILQICKKTQSVKNLEGALSSLCSSIQRFWRSP